MAACRSIEGAVITGSARAPTPDAAGRTACVAGVEVRSRAAAIAVRLVLLAACATADACGPKCQDHDGDGHGPGCKAGPDCDDHNPALTTDCAAVHKRCAKDPYAELCPCLSGEQRDCYSGADTTRDIGPCRAGHQTCPTGAWTACEGEVAPHYEVCNRVDDDCDGTVDEGVVSPCGGCNAQCSGGVWGPPAVPFEAAGDLAVTDHGELTLALYPIESRTVWVPNTGEGTLSKVDATSALEVARYRVGGETPERVAIDGAGDVFVLSPSLDGISTLNKVAGGEDACRAAPEPATMDPVQPATTDAEPCLLFSLPVGGKAELARALAVAGDGAPEAPGGNVWIGLEARSQVLELDGQSGALLRTLDTPGLAPYDAVFDPWGALWLIDRQGLLARIDPTLDPPAFELHPLPIACYTLDSLASDAQGALTLTGAGCEDALTYDPNSDRFRQIPLGDLLDARGVSVLGMEPWITHTAGRISRLSREPPRVLATYGLADADFSPIESIAIGADSLGQIWAVSSMGAPDGSGVLTRFDPTADKVTAEVPVGRLPRGQGDIAGDRRLGTFAKEASATHVFDGCSLPQLDPGQPAVTQPTRWVRLHVAWLPGVGSSVLVEARRADDRDALGDASFVPLGTLPGDESPFALAFDPGGVVEVRLTLRSGGRLGAPRIVRVGLEWSCPGPV